MRYVPFQDLEFALPGEDDLFHRTLPLFAQELPQAVELLPPGAFRPGGELLEAGAAFGVTGIAALRAGLFTRVHAFEPCPYNAKLARHNAQRNGYGPDRYTVYPYALTERNGKESFQTAARRNVGGGWLDPGGPIRVATRRLDDVSESVGIEPQAVTLVWVDVQGAEGRLLAGAERLLRAGAPWCVELAPHLLRRQGCTPEHFQQLLEPHFTHALELRFLRQPLRVDGEILAGLFRLWDLVYRQPRAPHSWHTNLLLYRVPSVEAPHAP